MTSRPIEKISYDGEFFSSKEMKLRFADFNAGAHFSNDAVLTLITDAHSDYLISKGLSLDNVNGSSIIFTAVTVNFLKEIAFAQLSSNTSLIMK
ncbi:hypothetical protein [Piscirickettsia salmonis]|nr:hypothetical protein [Piscirickettsia salmonis]QGP31007.1 hypothetical protein Psal160_03417 [Piscirickettsia salmonis]